MGVDASDEITTIPTRWIRESRWQPRAISEQLGCAITVCSHSQGRGCQRISGFKRNLNWERAKIPSVNPCRNLERTPDKVGAGPSEKCDEANPFEKFAELPMSIMIRVSNTWTAGLDRRF